MKNQLIIQEKYSRFWPLISLMSFLIAIALFISYLTVTDVLAEGYLRMGAFIFFAAGLLSLLKLRDGRIDIVVTADDAGVIRFEYNLRAQLIFHEEWNKNELHSLKIDEMPNRSLYNDIIQSDRCIRFRRENEAEWNYLNKVNGRVIPLSNESAKKLHAFLRNQKTF